MSSTTRFTQIRKSSLNSNFDTIRSFSLIDDEREACGVLLGHIYKGVAVIAGVIPVRNISEHPEVSFMFDPQDYYNAIKDTDWFRDDAPYSLLGVWHSHPNYPGYPSNVDWAAAVKGQVVEGAYLIYTTKGHDIYSYYWDGTQFTVLRQT